MQYQNQSNLKGDYKFSMTLNSQIFQTCNDDEIAFVGDFPERRIAISRSQRNDNGFMIGCKKLYTFPDFKEVQLN